MKDLETIQKMLLTRNLKKVSREVNIHYMTVYNIAKGKTKRPSAKSLKALSEFLEI
jgi:predicted transcriptional regulator